MAIIERIDVQLWTNQGETHVKIIGFDKTGADKVLINESNHGSWGADMRKLGEKGYYALWAPRFIGKELV